jgi:hypothetical protein
MGMMGEGDGVDGSILDLTEELEMAEGRAGDCCHDSL